MRKNALIAGLLGGVVITLWSFVSNAILPIKHDLMHRRLPLEDQLALHAVYLVDQQRYQNGPKRDCQGYQDQVQQRDCNPVRQAGNASNQPHYRLQDIGHDNADDERHENDAEGVDSHDKQDKQDDADHYLGG